MDKIAERVFALKRADLGKLREYGFNENEEGEFCLSCDIAEGRMRLGITVAADGSVRTKVTDVDTDDPYTLFLVEDAVGGFVGSVRADYERVLTDIAAKCFDREVFESGAAKAVLAYAERKYGNSAEYLWEKFPSNAILRRCDNNKWYAAILTVKAEKLGLTDDCMLEVIDLRGKPEFVARVPDGEKFFPGYHMNKKHWFTVLLDGSVPDDEICRLLDESYVLAAK